MRSPVLAILWQFLARNPVIVVVSALLWLVLAVLCRVVPVGPESPLVVSLLVLSFVFVLIGLLHTFSFSSVEPLASRESGFPRRMFLLPLSTPALVVAAACWLLGSGHYRDLLDAPFLEPHPGWQIAVGIVLVLGLLVVGTWLTLVSTLWLGLAGRGWVNLVAGLLFTIVWAPIGLAGYGLWRYPEYLPLLWRVLPWLAVVAVLLKFAPAAWIARAVHRRLVAPRTLVIGGAVWFVGVGGLLVLLALYLPTGLMPWSGLVLAAALLVPLNGLVAMPLALDWNRHR